MSTTDTPFVAIIPTFDLHGLLPLAFQVQEIAGHLERPFLPMVADRWGVWNSMYEACRFVGGKLGAAEFRALIVGSDTFIENPNVVARYIEFADEEACNFVADMKKRDGTLSFEGVESWEEIPDPRGYGFYYGTVYRDYEWHNDVHHGEDYYFLQDNHLTVRLAAEIKLKHHVQTFL